MMDLVLLFFWPIICSVLAAVSLGWTGMHFIARHQGLKILCISQGAALGSLLYLLFNSLLDPELNIQEMARHSGLPSALIFGWLAAFLVDKLPLRFGPKPHLNLSFFLILTAVNHLIAASFPVLESHMTQMFVGDPATLANRDALILVIIYGAGLFAQWRGRFRHTASSFDIAVLEKTNHLQDLFVALFVAVAIPYFGFLFTASFLYLPTILTTISSPQSMTQHYLFVALIAFGGSMAGFTVSMLLPNTPTVPLCVLMTCFMGSVVFAIYDNLQKIK
jgi:hypothetical protein